MKTLGCCGAPEGPTFIGCVFRNGEAVNKTITETVSLSGDTYASPLIYTSFYSEACVHTGCCCRAEAIGALVRPLVITLSLCFHTVPGSVWIRSACDWSHLMFTLQWLIRAAVTMSEGGRKLKTNSPIRQNHVLLIGGEGGSHSCSPRLTAAGGFPFDKYIMCHYLQISYRILSAAYLIFFTFLHGVKAFEHPNPAFLPRGAPTSGIQTLWLEQPLFLYSWKQRWGTRAVLQSWCSSGRSFSHILKLSKRIGVTIQHHNNEHVVL